MPRPKLPRQIWNMPTAIWYKPAGIPLRTLAEVVVTLDELEALRLADFEGLYQEQVAARMNVSRPTVGRILASAHRKLAEALVQGKAIRLEGGSVQFASGTLPAGPGCRGGGRGRRWRGGRQGQGPPNM